MIQPHSIGRLVLGSALVIALVAPVGASSTQKTIDRSFAAASIQKIEFENLAGNLEIVGGAADSVQVDGTLFAEDSGGKSSQQIVDMLEIEMKQVGDRLIVRASYPTGDYRRFHYPRRSSELERDLPWFLDWLDHSSTTVSYQGQEVRVTGTAGSSSATLYADFRLTIPAGIALSARNVVGSIRSTDLSGDQRLDTTSGPIAASGGRGDLIADTGSGDVLIENHHGNALADTGSGDVTMREVRGDRLAADTGSGDVDFVDCFGSIDADTGSGNVTGSGVVSGSRFHVDTGSGDVRFGGDFAAVRDLYIDTGSGDVRLVLSASPSVRLRVSTGSGDIDVDLPDMHVRRWKGDFVADVGRAEGNGKIDTGSGDVSLSYGKAR